MVARYVRDVEVPGSNPGSPTSKSKRGTPRYPFFVPRLLDRIAFIEELEGTYGCIRTRKPETNRSSNHE